MTYINPILINEVRGLRLTSEEKQYILSKMHPPAPDGYRYADAVFEGGGIKGIALLGAMRCCDDLGLRWQKLAGSSSGSLTAALLAANFAIDRLERELGELDYMQFLSQKTSPLIFCGDPRDDMKFPFWMLFFLLVTRSFGQYSSEPLHSWVASTLKSCKIKTFRDLEKGSRQLKVVASDISRREMLLLPDDLNPAAPNLENQQRTVRENILRYYCLESYLDFTVAEAVRLSLSIPLFFEPGRLGDYMILDGGLLSNFPLWIYDVQPQSGQPARLPRWPTFGFRLLDNSTGRQSQIKGVFDIFSASLRTMAEARDRYHLREIDRGRTIEIDVTDAGVTTTQFNVKLAEKATLYRLGYEYTKKFFLSEWNWSEHLRKRGFSPPNPQGGPA
ncbi:MAG: patatin-like phospholipase family protein [Hormoscilla sp. SP5CHS1]|nr:patatin-like phospholipase family protein [Hormoscilla sp. SP12CHS1]MBC6455834.1 patatin-like phospholipase family protein [Hormoscilla sp. SP5CHS1]